MRVKLWMAAAAASAVRPFSPAAVCKAAAKASQAMTRDEWKNLGRGF